MYNQNHYLSKYVRKYTCDVHAKVTYQNISLYDVRLPYILMFSKFEAENPSQNLSFHIIMLNANLILIFIKFDFSTNL
jgi:hypothetical protein